MHEPVKGHLEEYLAGVRALPAVEEHLKSCASCREEVSLMQMQSDLLGVLRVPREFEPSAGFYARVMNRIETQAKPSIWNLFGESMFAKRLAYASATFLVLMGTYFVSSSQDEDFFAVSGSPEMIMSSDDHEHVDQDTEKNREAVLVNLATYQE